jgi:hypothetical protein
MSEEAIVRKNEAEVSTPNLDGVLSNAQEAQEGREIWVRLTAESRHNMKKRALVAVEVPGFSTFSMWCDEGTSLGGDDSAPAPPGLLQRGHRVLTAHPTFPVRESS